MYIIVCLFKPGIALESVISTKAVSSFLAISNSFSPNRFNSSMAVAKSAGDKSKEELSSQIFSWNIDQYIFRVKTKNLQMLSASLHCQFYNHSQNSAAWWPYQIVGLIKDDYVSLYFYTMGFSWLKQFTNKKHSS